MAAAAGETKECSCGTIDAPHTSPATPAKIEIAQLWPPCSSCQAPCSPPLRLHPNFPQRKWTPRQGPVPTDALHWGQRKLLLTETAFLTHHAQAGDTVLYVGAAPGEHIILLACSLFPHLKFHCVDPRPMAFSSAPAGDPAPAAGARQGLHSPLPANVTQECGYFTAEAAGVWQGRAQLLLSDLRNTQDEQGVQSDMQLQEIIVRTVQPRAALLKFRLPWGSGSTQYLPGQVHMQPYAQGRSTETRLWVTEHQDTQEWDHEEYEDRLFWFNTELRSAFRVGPGAAASLQGGVPASWDGWAELAIWEAYLRSSHAISACKPGLESSDGLVRRAMSACGGGSRHLAWATTALLCCFKAADSNRSTWLSRAQAQRKRQRSSGQTVEAGGGLCWECKLLEGGGV